MNIESSDKRESIKQKVAEIEAEMKKINMWQTEPLKPEQYNITKAFGMDTMAFEQWLQFIFIPRVHEAVETNSFPDSSMVVTQAIREFDGNSEADHLVELLSEFDSLIN